ncbi:MAG TPA: carbohydrate ABC transporter permease, partial [Rectinema sp.]|nr:carbohydrate ABC transporter permease [Rectinema sp.]
MLKQKEISNIKAIRTRHILTFFQYLFAIVFTLIIVFPFYWMIITSLKTSDELLRPVPTLWPLKFQWKNYIDVFSMAPLGQYILNTIIMTAGIMTLQIIIGSFAAYGFSKGKFPGRDILFIVVLGALMVPIQVTFVPIYVMIAKLNWINTFAGLIVPNAVSAYTIFMLRQTFKSVDDAFIEAA